MADVISEFLKAKQRFIDVRGAERSYKSPTKLIPKTTWADAMMFGPSFVSWAEKESFNSTAQYRRAKATFEGMFPHNILWEQYGYLWGAELESKKDQVFPYNQAFWDAAYQYALSRSSLGFVQSGFDIAIESVKEAVQELPETIAGAYDSVVEAVEKSVPSLDPLARLVKWGTIGAIAFAGWWYVLRPMAKKKR